MTEEQPQQPQQRDIVRCSMCKMEHFADNFDVDRLGRRRKTCRDCKVRHERSGFMTRVRAQLAVNGLTVETLMEEYKYAGGDDANGSNPRHLHYYNLARPNEPTPEHVDNCEICSHDIIENCYIEHKLRGDIMVVGNCCIKRFVEDSGRTCATVGLSTGTAPTTCARPVLTRTASQPRRAIRAAQPSRQPVQGVPCSAAGSRRLTAPPVIAVTTVLSLQPFHHRWSSEPRPRIFGPVDTYGVGRKLN